MDQGACPPTAGQWAVAVSCRLLRGSHAGCAQLQALRPLSAGLARRPPRAPGWSRRLKMGVCCGVPKTIIPDHLGRADYHGASINQAARYMDAGAHGGQVKPGRGWLAGGGSAARPSACQIKGRGSPCSKPRVTLYAGHPMDVPRCIQYGAVDETTWLTSVGDGARTQCSVRSRQQLLCGVVLCVLP